MSAGNGILFVVPARGGSKGLPRKNIAPLAGRPLIAHVLTTARSAAQALTPHASRIVVTTDSEEIAAVAREWGAEIPALRPPSLARDDSPTIDAILHLLDLLAARERYLPAAVVIAQPTSPLAAAADFRGAVELFFASGRPVTSVTENEHPLEWTFLLDGLTLRPAVDWPSPSRRQDARKTYRQNGAIFVASVAQLRARCRFEAGDQTQALIMPAERSIDIDTARDLAWAEFLLQHP